MRVAQSSKNVAGPAAASKFRRNRQQNGSIKHAGNEDSNKTLNNWLQTQRTAMNAQSTMSISMLQEPSHEQVIITQPISPKSQVLRRSNGSREKQQNNYQDTMRPMSSG